MKSIRFGIVPSIIIGMSLCCTEIHGITFENEIHSSKQARANEWTSDAHSEITHNLFNFINNNQIITTQWFNSYQLIIMLFSIIHTIRMYDGIVGIDISLSLSLSIPLSLYHSLISIDRKRRKKRTPSTANIQVGTLHSVICDFIIHICSLENWITSSLLLLPVPVPVPSTSTSISIHFCLVTMNK